MEQQQSEEDKNKHMTHVSLRTPPQPHRPPSTGEQGAALLCALFPVAGRRTRFKPKEETTERSTLGVPSPAKRVISAHLFSHARTCT
eukprot:scaffold27109_cov152-Isochrysis_galbana.AAC.1